MNEVSKIEWELHWACIPKANLLQSWQYGLAKEQAEGWHANRAVVLDDSGDIVALLQWLTRTWPIFGGIARLNRGPLIQGASSEEKMHQISFGVLSAFVKLARSKRWWMLQVAPELPDTNIVSIGLKRLGFKQLRCTPWASALLDLKTDEKILLANLDGKWRGHLRKGEKLNVTATHHECKGEEQDLLIRAYLALQDRRGFSGLSEQIIRTMAAQRGPAWQFDLFIAAVAGSSESEGPLGLLVTIRHGDTATYLIGSTSDRGRTMQANYILLWQAILHSKRAGCYWFDVGGLNEETPAGIASFKRGLNATPYKLIGEWRKYLMPWRK